MDAIPPHPHPSKNFKQEYIPVGCVPPTLPPYGGVSVTETPRDRDPPVDRQTDTCENITLPKNSFAGGKNHKAAWSIFYHFKSCYERLLCDPPMK